MAVCVIQLNQNVFLIQPITIFKNGNGLIILYSFLKVKNKNVFKPRISLGIVYTTLLVETISLCYGDLELISIAMV